MDALPDVSTLATLIGDPARANMLDALMDGRALTAKELAYYGGISPQTASSHLTKLVGGGLLALEQHGRNRYYRLASAQVAEALESMMVLAANRKPARRAPSPALEAMRVARTCYDHLAGFLGVAVTEALIERGVLVPEGRDFRLDAAAGDFFAGLGIDVAQARRQRRAFARQCLDWTERRLHLAGSLGAALATRCLELDWVARMDDGRALAITAAGQAGFREHFGLTLPPPTEAAPPAAAGD